MNEQYKLFAIPKDGETISDDFAYIKTSLEGVHLLVISDGASGAIYSGDWAESLSKGFLDEHQVFEEDFIGWKKKYAEQWNASHQSSDQPWYIVNKVLQGSAASLHALIVSLQENTRCSSYCIGDSCLFILRNMEVIQQIPKMDLSDFNNSPDLLVTNQGQVLKPNKEVFNVIDGDLLLLMTDALAKWFIEEYSEYKSEGRWSRLLQINCETSYSIFLKNELKRRREDGRTAIQNDDFTLLKYYFKREDSITMTTGEFNGVSIAE